LKRAAITVLLFVCSVAAAAETIKGVVQNSTTNKPSAGDEVLLRKIGNGMEDVAKTKTNAKGEFTFNVPPAQMPYIIWIQHQGVTYTQRGVPGGNTVVARVFDAASDLKDISMVEHAMLFHTGDTPNTLTGEEIFTVNNTSAPPRTLLRPHTLVLYLPDGAAISEASVRTSSGTDIKSAVVPTDEKNKYAFGFPIRPGETQFHIVYSVPYSGKLKIEPKSDMPVDTLVVAAPEPIKFSPEDSGLYQTTKNPQFKNVNFFVAKGIGPQRQTAFEIAGSGAMPREEQQGADPATGQSRPGASGRPGGGLGLPNEEPVPLQSGQWAFLGVLSLFLAAGAVIVYTANQNPVVAQAGRAKPQERPAMLLEAMKEEVFQLESDRLQGKITPQDYQTAKAALDKTLQRAVQRQSGAK
jgi:hypothetical protein